MTSLLAAAKMYIYSQGCDDDAQLPLQSSTEATDDVPLKKFKFLASKIKAFSAVSESSTSSTSDTIGSDLAKYLTVRNILI